MKPLLPVVLVVALAGCSEYVLFFGKDQSGSPDGDDTDGAGATDSAIDTSEPFSQCQDLVVGTEEDVDVDWASYAGWSPIRVTDPWHATVEWQGDTRDTSMAVPLTGDVDADGDTEIVYVNANGEVVILDGATGAREAAWFRPYTMSATPALGDLDGDGVPEIVARGWDGHPIVLEADGTIVWEGSEASSAWAQTMAIADLDEDGSPEVIAGDFVYEADGTPRFHMQATPVQSSIEPAVADLDLDGDQEIVFDGRLYDSDGNVVWDTKAAELTNVWPLVVQADADPEGEVVFVTTDGFRVYDTDGTLLTDVPRPHASPGPPAAGDFDGDGDMELLIPWYFPGSVEMTELDGTQRWVDVTSSVAASYGAGIVGADLDGDGALEGVYAPDLGVLVYDGATGARLLDVGDHQSGTEMEYATVADVDGDDHAEILAVNSAAGWPGITVLGHDGAGWAPTGPAWSDYAFHQTEIEADLAVPVAPEQPFERARVWRARNASDGWHEAAADLGVVVRDVCVASCDHGPIRVAVQVDDHGSLDVPAGASLALYAMDGRIATLAATTTLPAIPAGKRLRGLVLDVPPALAARTAWRAVVDDDGSGVGTVDELHEDDNTDEYADETCP